LVVKFWQVLTSFGNFSFFLLSLSTSLPYSSSLPFEQHFYRMDWEKPPLQCLIYPSTFMDSPELLAALKDVNGEPVVKFTATSSNTNNFNNNNNNNNPSSKYKTNNQYEHLLRMIKDSGRSHMKPYEDRVFVPRIYSNMDSSNNQTKQPGGGGVRPNSSGAASSNSRSRSKYKIKEGGKTVFGQAYYRHCHQQRILPLSSIWNHELESQEHLYIESDRLVKPIDWEPIFKALRPVEKGGGCDKLKGIWIGSVWMDAWRYKEYLEAMKRGRFSRASTIGTDSTTSQRSLNNESKGPKKDFLDTLAMAAKADALAASGAATGPDWDEKMSAILVSSMQG
jgi:hypothetical protein